MGYEKDAIAELARGIKAAGFRVFIAELCTYGFYTDADGSRVVSFGIDLGVPRFSGNYTTDQPKMTGTGWCMQDGRPADFRQVFDAYPPSWAVGTSKWEFTTLARYLKTYQDSSKFIELTD